MAQVKISADSGGGSVALSGPASTTSNAAVNFKLPVADGTAGQVLSTDASGNLVWVNPGIIQIVQNRCVNAAAVTGTNTTYATTPENIIDQTQTEIRVKNASSKILITMANCHLIARREGPANAYSTIGYCNSDSTGDSKAASDYDFTFVGDNGEGGLIGYALGANRTNVGTGDIASNGGFGSSFTMQWLHTHGQPVDKYLYYTAGAGTTYTSGSGIQYQWAESNVSPVVTLTEILA